MIVNREINYWRWQKQILLLRMFFSPICELGIKFKLQYILYEFLLKVIKENGTKVDQEGHIGISFKRLFDIYINISNKVVGILLRARKYGLVDFRGEMLFQGRDDDVLIKLIKMDF